MQRCRQSMNKYKNCINHRFNIEKNRTAKEGRELYSEFNENLYFECVVQQSFKQHVHCLAKDL